MESIAIKNETLRRSLVRVIIGPSIERVYGSRSDQAAREPELLDSGHRATASSRVSTFVSRPCRRFPRGYRGPDSVAPRPLSQLSWPSPYFDWLEDSLAAKCSAMGVPANFSRSRREKSSRELSGR